jgi:hypothetical protein
MSRLHGVPENERAVQESPSSRPPNVTITDSVMQNMKTAVSLEGNLHMETDGFVVRNTPAAFELKKGATVDLKNTYYNPH